MKGATSAIELWNLIPQDTCSEFSYSAHFGTGAHVALADLQPFEIQEERCVRRSKVYFEITQRERLRNLTVLLKLAGLVSLDRAELSPDIESAFDALPQADLFLSPTSWRCCGFFRLLLALGVLLLLASS